MHRLGQRIAWPQGGALDLGLGPDAEAIDQGLGVGLAIGALGPQTEAAAVELQRLEISAAAVDEGKNMA